MPTNTASTTTTARPEDCLPTQDETTTARAAWASSSYARRDTEKADAAEAPADPTTTRGIVRIAAEVPAKGSLGGESHRSETNNKEAAASLSSSENVATDAATPPVALAAIGTKAPVALHTFSSLFASAVSTITFYPFDLLKTRFMSQDGTVWRQHNGRTYHSIARSMRTIAREEGVRTLFRGCTVAVCGSVTAWGLYMFFYRTLCNFTEASSFWGRSGLSISASLASSLLSSPIFLIKSRMQLEETTQSSHYRTFLGALRRTVATGGIRALWRGVSLQLLLVFPNALGIPMYDYLKSTLLQYRWSHQEQQRDMNIAEVCLCSTTTKIALLTLSHPLVMMKVRLQDQRSRVGNIQYKSVGQTLLTILKTQGLKGLYRGYSTALVHSLPRSLLHYVVYEKTLNVLCRSWD